MKDNWGVTKDDGGMTNMEMTWTGCKQQQKRGPDVENPSTHLHHCKRLLAGRIGGC